LRRQEMSLEEIFAKLTIEELEGDRA